MARPAWFVRVISECGRHRVWSDSLRFKTAFLLNHHYRKRSIKAFKPFVVGVLTDLQLDQEMRSLRKAISKKSKQRADSRFPADILIEIANHMDLDELKRLYSVNSLFLGLGLDALYNTVNILESNGNPDKAGRIGHFIEPYVASRIKHLILDSDGLQEYNAPTSTTLPTEVPKRSKFSDFLKRPLAYRDEDVPALCHVLISLLKNLDTITVHCEPRSNQGKISPLLIFLLSALVANHAQFGMAGLKALHIKAHFTCSRAICRILSVEGSTLLPVFLGSLEEFSLSLSNVPTEPTQPSDVASLEATCAFLHLLASPGSLIARARADVADTTPCLPESLKRLSVDFWSSLVHLSVFNSVFDTLKGEILGEQTKPPFPNLSHFSLTSSCLMADASSALQFLHLQRHTITHLRVISHPVVASAHELSDIPAYFPQHLLWKVAPAMSKLIYLEVLGHSHRPTVERLGCRTLRAYLMQAYSEQRPTNVETLVINEHSAVSYAELLYLFTGANYGNGNNFFPESNEIFTKTAMRNLRHISMTLVTLTPTHLHYFSMYFPHLDSLNLRVSVKQGYAPLRPSYTGWFDEPTLNQFSLTTPPVHTLSDQEQSGLGRQFIEEISSQVKRGKILAGWNWSWRRNEEGKEFVLQELRIAFQDLDQELLGMVRKTLKEAAPAVQTVVVGNGIAMLDSVFPPARLSAMRVA